jgi:hypothetical protein
MHICSPHRFCNFAHCFVLRILHFSGLSSDILHLSLIAVKPLLGFSQEGD